MRVGPPRRILVPAVVFVTSVAAGCGGRVVSDADLGDDGIDAGPALGGSDAASGAEEAGVDATVSDDGDGDTPDGVADQGGGSSDARGEGESNDATADAESHDATMDGEPSDAPADVFTLPEGAVCFPSGTQCSGTDVQTCDSTGQWGPPAACPAFGETCQGSSCQCPSGQMACDGACIDTTNDDANCGGCGLACSTSCTNGHCVVTLANTGWPNQIAVDATSVYWTDWNGGAKKVPVFGGAVTTLSPSTGPNTEDIAVDSAFAFWASDGAGLGVHRVPLGGGASTLLTPYAGMPIGVAVEANNVYWTDRWTGEVNAVRVGGGNTRTLAVGSTPTRIAADSTSVYWVDPHSPSGYATVSTLMKVPVTGGTPVQLASAPGELFEDLAIDAVNVYVANEGSSLGQGSVVKVPIAGGAPVTLASGQAPSCVAVDATYVYWANNDWNGNPATIMKVPISGGTPTMLAQVQEADDIAVDATSVYWTTGPSGSVMKVTPK